MNHKNFFLFRALTSSIFLYAGANHLFQPQKILAKVAGSRAYTMMDIPAFFSGAVILSGVVMMIAGSMLFAGYKTKTAATVLLAILIPITLMVQLENLYDLGPFFKNVAIAGSLLFIIKFKPYEMETSPVRGRHANV